MTPRFTSPLGGAALLALLAIPVSYDTALPVVPATPVAGSPGSCGFPPETVRMRPTQQAPGGRASMILTQPPSPFGVAVDAEGRQVYHVQVQIEQMRRRAGRHYVVWATTPDLDEVAKLGSLGEENHLTGPVAWNKFLVFVTEEASLDGETWAGPILLTGLSPSGRMHTMAGHGPFEDANCSDFIY